MKDSKLFMETQSIINTTNVRRHESRQFRQHCLSQGRMRQDEPMIGRYLLIIDGNSMLPCLVGVRAGTKEYIEER